MRRAVKAYLYLGLAVAMVVASSQVNLVVNDPKTIKLAKTAYVYNGKVQKPAVTVKTGDGKTLSKSNYKVTYSKGCKAVGTYTATITFTGNYSGTVPRHLR